MKTRAIALTASLALAATAVAAPVAAVEPFADEDKPYVAIVSKGFMHQFLQAVEGGAYA